MWGESPFVIFFKRHVMSRFENHLLPIASGASVSIFEDKVCLEGAKGKLDFNLPKGIKVSQEEKGVKVFRSNQEDVKASFVGLTYRMIENFMIGVTKGFTKQLELHGVGYRWSCRAKKLTMNLGFSHPVEYDLPEDIEAKVDENKLSIMGFDKQLVGEVSAKIRSFRSLEPYKGKGVRYVGETFIKKQGKSSA